MYVIFIILPLISAANWMASPMMPMFCTPDVKIPSRSNSTVLSRLPETNEQPIPSHTETPRCPDFETRWIQAEAKFLNSNSVRFHTLYHKQFFKFQLGLLSNTSFSYIIVGLSNGNFVRTLNTYHT